MYKEVDQMQISDVVSYVKESQAEINPAVLKTVL
jgi:hypothetical protein